MLSATYHVRCRQDTSGRLANSILASLLVLLFVTAATVSTCHGLHRALHNDNNPSHPFCLACSVAKSQFHGADPGLVLGFVILGFLVPVFPWRSFYSPPLHLRLVRSRGPPR